jgi:hypothetical protein
VLTHHLGDAIDTVDPLSDGRLTAHGALRAVEWALDAAGLEPPAVLSRVDALAGGSVLTTTGRCRSARTSP